MTMPEKPSSEREQRLERVLADYLHAVERGETPNRDELLARHPDLAEELCAFFRNRDAMQRLAQPLRKSGPPLPDTSGASAPAIEAGVSVPYFGDYEILEEIARGGMGVVYRARQISLNRVVALKMILAGELADVADVRRFYAEAEAAANLDHPNIVPIYEVGEYQGQHYFSMKLIEGTALTPQVPHLVEHSRTAARLLATVARAVHHAHQRGILHRDIKPGNILLDDQGQPHVTDFGLAKRVEGDAGQTRSGAVVGTPSYMAPEQAVARKGLTTAVDVYGVGAILYECLTGRPPFQGSSPLETLLQVVDRDPDRPRSLRPGVDRDLETICLKCLEKDPAKRYASAEDLADDLERFLAGEPIRARRVGRIERALKWARRRPAAAAAFVLAGLVLVFGVLGGGAAYLWQRAESARHEAVMARDAADVARREAVSARQETEKQRDRAEAFRLHAERLSASITLDHAVNLGEHQDAGRGTLQLVRGLRNAPSELEEVRRSFRRSLAAWRPQVHPLLGCLEHTGLRSGLVVVSPDGKTVLQTKGTSAELWDLPSGKLLATLRHEGAIRAAAFSPDGKKILTGGLDQTARLWNTATGESIGGPLRHQSPVLNVTFSPDGKLALANSTDTVLAWETATGKLLGTPMKTPGFVHEVNHDLFFSPDSKTLVTTRGRSLNLWDPLTGQHRGTPLILWDRPGHFTAVNFVVFSPDSSLLLATSPDGPSHLWHLPKDNPGETRPALPAPGTVLPLGNMRASAPRDIPLHQSGVFAAAFSSDGKVVVTAGTDNTARLWDTATGQQRFVLEHRAQVFAVAFSPDGKTLLTGSADRTAQLWETSGGKRVGAPLQHQGDVEVVAFSPDGETALTGSADGTARLWNAAGGAPIGAPLEHPTAVRAVSFPVGGKTVLTRSHDHTVRLWEMTTGKFQDAVLRQPTAVEHVAFSPDGKTILTATRLQLDKFGELNCEVRLWQPDGKPRGEPLPHAKEARTLLFSPDGRTILTRDRESAYLWDVMTATKRGIGIPCLTALAFSPDGKVVLAADSYTVNLWDVDTGKPRGVSFSSGRQIRAAVFSPDGKTIATTCVNDETHLWEAATGKPLCSPLRHPIRTVAFSSDGRTLLTAGEQRTQLWETATGKPRGSSRVHAVLSLVEATFSPDGKLIVLKDQDGTIRLCEAETGEPSRQVSGVFLRVVFSPSGRTILTVPLFRTASLRVTATGEPVGAPLGYSFREAVFSPDEKLFVTLSYDGTARLWEAATGKPLGMPYPHRDRILSVAFSPDGRTVATGSTDNTARLWQVPNPVEGSVERLERWVQVMTGMELDDAGGVRLSDGRTWRERRRRLEELGGPPAP
jgi:WD40 repeat protein